MYARHPYLFNLNNTFCVKWELKNSDLVTTKITERHISDNICNKILSSLTEFNLYSKLVCLVTDNASNMVKAGNLLNKKHLSCFAPNLQFFFIGALNISDVKTVISKTKYTVTILKYSNVVEEKFKAEQMKLSKP